MKGFHVSMLDDTSIRFGCENNGARFDKCGIQGCIMYALIKTAAILTRYTVNTFVLF